MSDIIKLLPDHVASQIAAGEVVQRPASVIKELMENALDAGAKSIKVLLKDAGRTLIQVIDDGKGMSATDARMSFERHATSKLAKAEDLFSIVTMGFRGEALAAIAAVSQVELMTQERNADIGCKIQIEGSRFITNEAIATLPGTSIAVKNLFFNIPARRNFLKSDQAELKHAMEEFYRISIANPQIKFSLWHNDHEVYTLSESTQKQRIVALFGSLNHERLVNVEENTPTVSLKGFVSKPDYVKKTRGEQYLWVNGRFFKDSYLNHAIHNAFDQIIPQGYFVSYFIQLQVDPAKIDVNIHPTKTEIKFEEDKVIYSILKAAVRKAIGMSVTTPALDFEQNDVVDFNKILSQHRPSEKADSPGITVRRDYNPFHEKDYNPNKPKPFEIERVLEMYRQVDQAPLPTKQEEIFENEQKQEPAVQVGVDSLKKFVQHKNRYIVGSLKSGLMIMDQVVALQKLLMDDWLNDLSQGHIAIQQLLFPIRLDWSQGDCQIIENHIDLFQKLGYDLSLLGPQTFSVNGIPAGIEEFNEDILEQIVELVKEGVPDSFEIMLQRIMLSQRTVWEKWFEKYLSDNEMQRIVAKIFSTPKPDSGPGGKTVFKIIQPSDWF